MNFHQLQYALAVAKNGLSVTNAAAALGTSQPAISRALKELEKELGFDLFVREGRSFARVTPEGTKVLEYAARALAEIESLRAVAADLNQDSRGVLSIATTHTQARYVLPPVVQAFRKANDGRDPGLLEAVGYDAGRMLRQVIEKQRPATRAALRDALGALKDFDGATGKTSFDEKREAQKPLFLIGIDSKGVTELEAPAGLC